MTFQDTRTTDMEFVNLPLRASRIALGTWAIGGWMWGGTDEDEAIRTINAALDAGSISSIRRRFTDSAVLKRSSAWHWHRAGGGSKS